MSVSNAAAAPWMWRKMDIAIVLAAIGAIVGSMLSSGGADGWACLHWVCKPLATVLILWSAWRAQPPVSAGYQRWLVTGMLFSLAGDIFLMLPVDAFVAGLVAFLIGHVFFIRALMTDTRFAARPLAVVACLAYGALNLWALWPALPGALHLPVVIYVVVLASMAGQAVARAWRHAHDALAGPAQWAAAGALLFLLSDTLLAWNRFKLAIPMSALWILATYYAALWCLARSVRRGG
ncbi:MAG TPA: lysoplasmalogenase [Dyella sp.]|uniref:lysoplasmalogenase n=1 Tax=Dyella sp. TaxID=1869338 RepID=UPI002D76C22A|nr:lysoplasmalogenase [Dyella sp.]HET6555032.1 lysoplasmalogenase [Dyella sp.]